MKKIFGLLMILVMGSITHASDNRSAPNVFSSGSTISSSQMNENFNFLASEIREKDVYCDNGERISDAINEGYNSLVIYGECIEAIGVYRLNPEVFGMNYSDMPNKPTSFLMIEGASDGTGIISRPTNSNFDFFIKDNSFVQLSEITINHQFSVDEGSFLRIENATINGSLEVNNNATLKIENSTLVGNNDNPALRVKASGHAHIHKTNITASTNGYEAIWLWNNASMMLQGSSVVTAPAGITGINMTTGSTAVLGDDVQINSVDRVAIQVDKNGTVEINDNVVVSRSDGDYAIFVDPTSALRINGSDITISGVSCGGVTSYIQNDGNNTVNISDLCNSTGSSPIFFTYTDFGPTNCSQMGMQDLTESQCSNFQPNEGSTCDGGVLPGCWYDSENGFWLYNTCGNTSSGLMTVITAVACKNFTLRD